MALNAGFQQIASNPNAFQKGVPITAPLDGYTIGSQTGTDVAIASAVYYVDNGTSGDVVIKQTQSVGDIFAGIVTRSNANSIDWAQSRGGFSDVVAVGQTASITVRGSIPVPVAIANEVGGIPKIGSAVYAMPNGTWQTQSIGGTAPTNGNLTNFRVFKVTTGWVANALVVITNTQNVGV